MKIVASEGNFSTIGSVIDSINLLSKTGIGGKLSKYKVIDGQDTIYPVLWNKCIEEYTGKPYENYINILREHQPLLILVGAIYRKLKDLSVEEILKLKLLCVGTMGLKFN